MNPFGSLTLRTALLASLPMVLCGGLALVFVEALANRWETAREREAMTALMELMAPSATAACFVGDATLAAQVVHDLARAPGVQSARLQDSTTELARAGPDAPAAGATFSRKLWSPFSPGFQVGELTLTSDSREALRQGAHVRLILRLGLAGLSLASAVALILALRGLIARPLQRVVEALGTGGDETPLVPPRGHGRNELGRLVEGVNQRLASLRKALAEGNQAREALAAALRRQGAILDNAGAGIFVLDRDGALVEWNLPFLRLLGLEHAPPAPGTPLAPLFQAEEAQVQRCLAQCKTEGTHAWQVLRVRDPDLQGQPSGHHHWLHLSLRPVGPDWFQGLVEPLSARPARMATDPLTHDPATGALNRLGAERAIAEAFADAPDELTLMLVALPNPADTSVERLAQAARLGPSSQLAQLNDQEFLLILRNREDRILAADLGERLSRELGAAVGIAEPDPREDPRADVLLKRADQALHRTADPGS